MRLKKSKLKLSLTYFLILVILLSIFIRSFFLHPNFSDETFYYNVGKAILKGQTPYKDFFFAHPPFQIFSYFLFFKLLGTSFLYIKFFILLISSACLFLVFLIVKSLYSEKTAFLASTIFIFSVPFLSFSTIGYGMWEAMLLFLSSFYLLTKGKIRLSALTLSISIFFRYLVILYIPFFIIFLILRKNKPLKFIIYSLLFSSSIFLLLIYFFSSQFIIQTVIYHLKSNLPDFGISQYWNVGFFLIFSSLISAFVGHGEKDKILVFLSLTPIIIDLIILFVFKQIFYHYFLISLPIYCVAISISLLSKIKIIKIIIPAILILSIVSNIKTIDFYNNPINSIKFQHISQQVLSSINTTDKIFGEPVITNYISFISDRKISKDFYDSYMKHFVFVGENNILKNLREDMPKIFIEMDLGVSYFQSNPNFNQFLNSNYKLLFKENGTPSYYVFELS